MPLIILPLRGQTGPGGVGDVSSNGLWLRADDLDLTDGDPVLSWADASGNGNDAEQTDPADQPSFLAVSSLNGRPAVAFDGVDDQMLIADDVQLDGTSGITFFAVLRPRNLDGLPRGILGKRIDYTVSNDYAYTWFFYKNNTLDLDVNDDSRRFNTDPTTFTNNTNHLLAWDFDGTRPEAQRSRIYAAGAIVATGGNPETIVNASAEEVVLGALNENYRSYLGADYAEIIHFSRVLSGVERNLVHNYLAAKYDIPLTTGDLFPFDDAAGGNYEFDLAGIGRDANGVAVTESRGTGLVTIAAPTDLTSDEYLLWGHDGGSLARMNSGDLPAGVSTRMGREWRIGERSTEGSPVDVGAVDITFDLSETPPAIGEDLRLLIDTDNDGLFADEVPIGGATANGGSSYTFANVTGLGDGSRFTLGEESSALPGRLHDFRAWVESDGSISLEWAVFEERNRDYFAVDWSVQGTDWKEIGRTEQIEDDLYRYRHTQAAAVDNYYRVRQVDFDGSYTLSPVRVVRLEAEDELRAFPNPFRRSITLVVPEGTAILPAIYAADGREVTARCHLAAVGANEIRVDPRLLPPGPYVAKWPDGRTLLLLRR